METALLAVSVSLTVTAVPVLISDAKADSVVFPNLVVEVIAAVIVAPVSGRTTVIEFEEIDLRLPTTEMMVL